MAYQIAIDIGNTATKIGLFNQTELVQHQRFENDDVFKNASIFQEFNPQSIIISSVNSVVEKVFDFEKSQAKVINLNHQTPLPFTLEYQTPDTLGKDRIAAVAGARTIFPNQNVLVIDAGTCLTYDLLTKDKAYHGGAISPGVQMRLQSMHHFTNKLPLLNWEFEMPQKVGKSTITSMLSGAVRGLILEIDGFIQEYEKSYENLKVILTGGDAKLFEKELKNGIFADPNLVLKGLNEILIYNCE